MRRAVAILAAMGGAALLVAGSAEATIKHKRAPKVRGPLELSTKSCERTPDREGAVASCQFFYNVDPARDGDPARDYGVVWSQVKFVNRGCPNTVWSRTRSNALVRVHRTAPARTRIKRRRTKRFTTRLRVRASTGERLGSVAKGFKLWRGTLKTTVGRRDSGRKVLRQRWRGPGCRRRIGLAYGAEYSVPQAPADAARRGAPGRLWSRGR